ncbi:ribulose-phosphate 3-epimerase [Clostridium beijerinckii]|jgi:ribulose-5-phosphate 3-epimerase (EC 5.1.3.1)|uniref:Ribulose-phosphate 3-epimerase n=2 Tax=Clostridium beijerinckii TaxID=1520 RepID=A0AAE2RPG1_CLOBE|nr:ribulose-phosphate 3-epimerase [Clostridium beijerinckii]ABR32416.1 Ribulose-phosphate 3-epimerase [Clostridium beijerinckii NCIMB 8052]AIU03764.1 ribulose-phosphate 3-epimerase [Clostridium beijerinckii ATCC 35702]MBF7807906.1 ribulose-phosphate 3-epimerase [Clostridium beijerinckii]NRT26362.1 ribulose-phosphate 3-epimerase [Clostridium beijerinckii]NRT66031.1 ribulose-phosphate 3-epimerase [Clostridium beijerinckii]
METIISPSLLSANVCNYSDDFKVFNEKNIQVIHIDIMDGHYVPNISIGLDQVASLRKLTDAEFDVHLMVTNPDEFVEALVEAGANSITIHSEVATHLYKSIHYLKSFGIKAGVALNPATPISCLEHVYSLLDRVLVMSVEPGFGGQTFIPFSLEKIRKLNDIKSENNYGFTVQVDGGINLDNIEDVIKSGARDIVIGSSLFRENLSDNIDSFNQKIIGINNTP